MSKKQKGSPLKSLEIVFAKDGDTTLGDLNRSQLTIVANFYGFPYREKLSGMTMERSIWGYVDKYSVDMSFISKHGARRYGISFYNDHVVTISTLYTALMTLRVRKKLPTHIIRKILWVKDEFITRCFFYFFFLRFFFFFFVGAN